VRFTPQSVPANTPIDEAEMKKLYEFRKDTLSKPEVRTVVQIPAKDAATAQKVTAALRAGQAPEAVAKSVGGSCVKRLSLLRPICLNMRTLPCCWPDSTGSWAEWTPSGCNGLALSAKLTSPTDLPICW